MMKRKATPKPKPSPRSTSTPPQTNSSANRIRSQSVASRRPTPASSHGGSRAPKSATDEEVDNLYRVRSFTTRTGVVVNRGDSFKKRGARSDRTTNDDIDDLLPGPQSGRIHPPPDDPLPGPQSGRIHPPPADPFPGPQSGRIHAPPPASVSFAAQHKIDDESEPIPIGAGHIVRQFVDREQYSVPPDSSVDGPQTEPPHPPRTSRPSLAAAGGVGRKGHYPSAGDAGAEDSSAPPVYKVLVLGSQGVGIKTLTKQLLSSEYYSSDCNTGNTYTCTCIQAINYCLCTVAFQYITGSNIRIRRTDPTRLVNDI